MSATSQGTTPRQSATGDSRRWRVAPVCPCGRWRYRGARGEHPRVRSSESDPPVAADVGVGGAEVGEGSAEVTDVGVGSADPYMRDQDAGSVVGKDPLRFNNWMKRSTTGAVIAGIALGLHQALEPEKPAVPFVIEASEPDDPDGLIDLRFDPDNPSATVAIIRSPVTDDRSDSPSRSMPAEPGTQADRHLPRRSVDDQYDAHAVGEAGGGVVGRCHWSATTARATHSA